MICREPSAAPAMAIINHSSCLNLVFTSFLTSSVDIFKPPFTINFAYFSYNVTGYLLLAFIAVSTHLNREYIPRFLRRWLLILPTRTLVRQRVLLFSECDRARKTGKQLMHRPD